MSKITFALAAALVAGTTMTSVANADAVRLGFGFPLGSFVAHSNENGSGRDYQGVARRRSVPENTASRKIAKVKRPRAEVAKTTIEPRVTRAVQTAKLESKLPADSVTTATTIEKTPVAKGDATLANTAAGSITATATSGTASAEKTASTDKSVASKVDTAPAPTATQHICRRYSPAIAALIDVPCE